jgi:hypothetical protein
MHACGLLTAATKRQLHVRMEISAVVIDAYHPNGIITALICFGTAKVHAIGNEVIERVIYIYVWNLKLTC